MTLNAIIGLFDQISTDNSNYKYCKNMADHIRKVAHPSVRNVGTIGGNLMLKHAYQDFPSDLFLLVETIGAKLMIKSPDAPIVSVTPLEFLAMDMANKVLMFIEFPPTTDYFFLTRPCKGIPIYLHHYFNKCVHLFTCLHFRSVNLDFK